MTPTAAATVIVPEEVVASLIGSSPLPSPPFSVACSLAWLRLAAITLLMPVLPLPSSESSLLSSGVFEAPAAEAMASDELADWPKASRVTLPSSVVVTSRSRMALTLWSDSERASARPTAAEPAAFAAPLARRRPRSDGRPLQPSVRARRRSA